MQGVVQALITCPQLDPIPFRQRHIQAVIRPLLVLVCYGESAVSNGGHIAEYKGQGEQIPDRLAGFVRCDAASPRRPQEGTDHLRGEVIRYRHVDHLTFPVFEEGLSRSGVVFCGDFPFDDNTTIDH